MCGSRITESALLLSLLQRTGARPDLRPGLHNFLSTARPAHPFEHLVQAAVAGTADAEVSAFLTGFTHPTGERKKLLLAAILALAADTPFPHMPLIPRRANAIWTDVALCALTIIDGVDDTSRCMTFLAELDPSRYRRCPDRARAYLAKIAGAASVGIVPTALAPQTWLTTCIRARAAVGGAQAPDRRSTALMA